MLGFDDRQYVDELMESTSTRKQEVVYGRAVISAMLRGEGYTEHFVARTLGIDRSCVNRYGREYVTPTNFPAVALMADRLKNLWNGHTEAVEALSAA